MTTRTTLGGAAAALLAATAIAVLPGVGHARSTSDYRPADACNGTHTHCEVNQCDSAVFYRNYNPSTDKFSDEYGSHLVKGEQGDIRDEPYRRTGPRGVVGFHSGHWGFYSTACFPG